MRRRSATPDVTALTGSNAASVDVATRRARVVFPVPGGPPENESTAAVRPRWPGTAPGRGPPSALGRRTPRRCGAASVQPEARPAPPAVFVGARKAIPHATWMRPRPHPPKTRALPRRQTAPWTRPPPAGSTFRLLLNQQMKALGVVHGLELVQLLRYLAPGVPTAANSSRTVS